MIIARALILVLMASLNIGAALAQSPELHFRITQGAIDNDLYRNGPVAAHIVLKSGKNPRLIVAFPAGNSGVGLWFAPQEEAIHWRPVTRIKNVTRRLPDKTIRHGVVAQTSISAPTLDVSKAILSNVRVLRDFGYVGKIPEEVESSVRVNGRVATWERRRIDGGAGYLLSVEVLNGRVIINKDNNHVQFISKRGAPLQLRLTAMTGDPALTPIPTAALFTADAAKDQRLRNVLAFLSYDEKFLAGSWRFNTYFGRDTLMSIRLLMPALTPHAIEAALGSVLRRLGEAGDVAHEEDLEEYALLTRKHVGVPQNAKPIFDYKMIDDDYMLAPILAHYLLDTPQGRARAGAFLDQKTPEGETYGARLVRNLRFILQSAAPFAQSPEYKNLIEIKRSFKQGQWRDSDDGLGGGRYPYDVNGVLVPAALRATARLIDSGLLNRSQDGAPQGLLHAATMAALWESKAPKLFEVRADNLAARAMIRVYAKVEEIDPVPALVALGHDDIVFHALALGSSGQPIRVLNSDEGFALLFGTPDPETLKISLEAIMRPFPAGLMTPVGMLVANPALAEPKLQPMFGRNRYHGSVVWSWQQALLAAGIARQRQRADLPTHSQALLAHAEEILWRAIEATHEARSSELWSWSFKDGSYTLEPFGQRESDETESNAAQLWSTVYLGITPKK